MAEQKFKFHDKYYLWIRDLLRDIKSLSTENEDGTVRHRNIVSQSEAAAAAYLLRFIPEDFGSIMSMIKEHFYLIIRSLQEFKSQNESGQEKVVRILQDVDSIMASMENHVKNKNERKKQKYFGI